jgi:N-terminal domain of (some) glycogen debranching enzymes
MGFSVDTEDFGSRLVRLRPRPDVLYTGQSRTVMATALDGQITGSLDTGLFAYETRVLSRYCYLIEGRHPIPVALSNFEQHNWMGYYIEVPPGAPNMCVTAAVTWSKHRSKHLNCVFRGRWAPECMRTWTSPTSAK